MSGSAPDDLYSLLGGAHSGIEAPIGDRRIPCVPPLPAQHTFPALTFKRETRLVACQVHR